MVARFRVAVFLVIAAAGALGVAAWSSLRSRPSQASAPPARNEPGLFRECATEVGIAWQMHFLPGEQGEHFKINLYDHGCGLAVGDFNGDGFEDIYFVNQLGPNALYRNRGDGTFVNVAKEAGVELGDRICVAATFADYNNDGRPGLFVTSTRGGNVLFKNMGDGTFKDVTRESGLTCIAHSQTAVFFDYDIDGYLDLFVTNSADWTASALDKSGRYYPGAPDLYTLAASPIEHNVLYHNNRDGTFTDVTDKAGLQGHGWGGDVVVFDYNDDGRLDLLVTNMFGASQLYRNNGDGTFTDVTGAALGRTSWGAVGAKAFDFNNRGKLDLLLVDMHSDMWLSPDAPAALADLARKNAGKKYPGVMGGAGAGMNPALFQSLEQRAADMFRIRYDEVVFGNTLFRNLGDGKFEEVADQAGMETFWPWGVATGDFDNDGHEDVFLPSGMGYPFFYWPNALMMNNGNGTFTDRAATEGIEPPPRGIYQEEKIGDRPAARSSRCAVTGDFSGSGRLDIVTNNFNDQPYFFKNESPRKNYVAFRLRGTQSNRDAIGAVVRVHVGGKILTRQVQPAGGYLSQSSRTLHFGLGDEPRIDAVEIVWPRGTRQRLENIAINTRHDLVEPTGPQRQR
jgi:hypothetical protein